MAGLMEGYLGGLQFLSGVQDMQQKKETFNMQQQKYYQAAQENQQEKGILADVFKAQAWAANEADDLMARSNLARKFQDAGSQLLSVNPKTGMDLLKQADAIREKVQGAALEKVQTGLEQDKLTAGRAASVFDQASLSAFVQDMAKVGKTIPPKYQQWNPETERWMQRQSMLNATGLQQKQLELSVAREKNAERELQIKAAKDDAREKLDSSKEARLQQSLEIRTRGAQSRATADLGLKSKADWEGEIASLAGSDTEGNFKSLNPGMQRIAAQDVRARAQKMYADTMMLDPEDRISKEEALRQARESVLGEIKVKGTEWYNPFKGETTREAGSLAPRTPEGGRRGKVAEGGGGEKPTAPAVQGFNKVFSDADYNALKSGATFKGPDGVLRRKP